MAAEAWNIHRRTKLTNKNIEAIHDSFDNGQKRQMVEQIDEYGSGFWEDYRKYLDDTRLINTAYAYYFFSSVTISYFNIKVLR